MMIFLVVSKTHYIRIVASQMLYNANFRNFNFEEYLKFAL